MIDRWLIALMRAWREWRCDHWWRPARYRFYPAKVCDECGKFVRMTHGEFYAEFGIVFSVITGGIEEVER